MALGDGKARILVHGAQHRHVGVVLDHRPQLGLMSRASQPGQNHAGNPNRPVERLIAEDQRRDTARHAARIEHQHHRQIQQLCQRRVAVVAVEVEAVVQALVALDQTDVGERTVARKLELQLARRGQVEIEVAAAAPGRGRKPHRIDVIRTLLERLHGETAPGQLRRQADADGGLARRLVRSGNEESVHASFQARGPPRPQARGPAVWSSRSGRSASARSATATIAAASPTPPRPSSTSGTLGV